MLQTLCSSKTNSFGPHGQQPERAAAELFFSFFFVRLAGAAGREAHNLDVADKHSSKDTHTRWTNSHIQQKKEDPSDNTHTCMHTCTQQKAYSTLQQTSLIRTSHSWTHSSSHMQTFGQLKQKTHMCSSYYSKRRRLTHAEKCKTSKALG
ncbi:hypothetical protein I3760_11G069200 [Carya illinoinensis]|nr:hypothetical protein I3760_11G069200 [Carya illinoinensis]